MEISSLTDQSIQLNVGIIAATIPTLKPLLKKSGLVSSGDRYNQFDLNDRRAGGTIGSGRSEVLARTSGTLALCGHSLVSSEFC